MTVRPCWAPGDARWALPIDAGAMTDAHFQAVHVPAWIARRPFGTDDDSRDEVVNEEQVLEDLLRGEATMRVAAIMGEVGTGKSHLARWLYAELRRRQREDRAGYSRYHIVYIPKRRTTLRGIVDRILKDQHGPAFDAFRARLQQAQDGFKKETAPVRLRDELANSLRDLRDDPTLNRMRGWLLGDSRLPDLIQDKGFKDTILREDGVIARTVEHALERSGIEEDGRPRFVASDLEVEDHGVLHREVQSLYRRLLSRAEYMEECVSLLNETLTRAVGRMFDVGKGQVGEIFQDVRAHLQTKGMELVLLVEDFALLQGIELDLLEAIIAPIQEVDSDEVLCPVRAAFAVTPGHFKDMHTVISRLDADGGFQYSLDAPIQSTEGAAIERQMIEFVGAYLNAARIGKDSVAAWHDDARRAGEDVPNRCEDCELRLDCHRAFGASNAGHGLYPFNRLALRRIALGHRWTHFDPRGLLKHMRGVTVDEHPGLANGTFPNLEWATEHNWAATPISQSMRRDTERRYDSDAERAQVLLVFWGAETAKAAVLDPDVHQAFRIDRPDGLPLVDSDAEAVVESDAPVGVSREPTPPVHEPKAKKTGIDADLERLDAWRSAADTGVFEGNEIDATMARDLRGDLTNMLLRRVTSASTTRSFDDVDVRQLAGGIEIVGAAAGNPQSAASTVMRIDTADTELLIALRKHRRRIRLDRSDLLALLDGQRRHAPKVAAWLDTRAAGPGGVEPDIRGLLAYACISGAVAADDAGLPSTYLAEFPRIAAPAEAPVAWREFVQVISTSEQIRAARERLLATFAVRQSPRRSTAKPSAVDSAPLVPALESALKEDLRPGSSADELSKVLVDRLPAALQAAKDRADQVPTLVSQLGPGTTEALARSLEESMASINVGVGGGPALPRARRALERLRELDLEVVVERCSELAGAATTRDTVIAAAAIPWEQITTLEEAVAAVSEYMDHAQRRLRDHRAEPGTSPLAARDEALDRREALIRVLNELRDVVSEELHV